jgi:hypothetical protein
MFSWHTVKGKKILEIVSISMQFLVEKFMYGLCYEYFQARHKLFKS